MKLSFILLLASVIFSLDSCSQNNIKQAAHKEKGQEEIKVGGGCEGCDAIYESPVSFEKLASTVTLPDFNETGSKIGISGIVYQRDGKTPAKDIVIYIYHTDQTGHYSTKGNEAGWGKRHGYIRAWIKTDKNGFYQFYTLRPAPYPGRHDPAHIHVSVKEPGKSEYWIDEYLFNDDPLLTDEQRKKQEQRGGNGIIELVPQSNGTAHGTRHIILGMNVPDYPYTGLPTISSGLAVGSACPAFDPLHLSGADKGKHACPMCKYGYQQGVMIWFNHNNLDLLKEFAKALEGEMEHRGEKNFRVFLIYMNPSWKSNDETGQKILQGKIEKWCTQQNLQRVAMLWVPSPVDKKSCGVFKINPEALNTVMVYKKRKVAAKWSNIEYDDASLKAILEKIDSQTI